jgi:hypothetical protein
MLTITSRRRAKIKMIAKKGLDGTEDLDGIPDSMRQLLAMQAMEAGRPFPRHLMGRPGAPMQYGNGMLMGGDPNGTGKVGKLRPGSIASIAANITK